MSVGLGAYVLKGIPGGDPDENPNGVSPLRFGSDQTVLSAFATGSVKVLGPIGIDVSFWYLGSTGRYANFKKELEELAPQCYLLGLGDCSAFLESEPLKLPSSISKTRLTVGIGFSF